MALEIVIVRHAIAEDKEVFKKTGLSDELRPLTKDGRRRFKKVARSLSHLVKEVDLLATSPLLRARETAEILKDRYPNSREILIEELKPGVRSKKILDWLRRVRATRVVLVGHQPDLGRHMAYFLTGSLTARAGSAFDIKKGGVCIVEFADRIEKGAAKLKCFIQPSELKKIAQRKR